MSLTLRKVAIKDPDSADMVLLSNIREGVDGAADIGFTQDGDEIRIEDNQTYEHSHNGQLDIKVLQPGVSDVAILNGLIGKRVEVSGWTIEGFLLFRDTVRLNRNPDYNSQVLNDRLLLTQKAPKGYSSGSSAFYVGPNALSLYNFRSGVLGTGGANDMLYGFEAESGVFAEMDGALLKVTTDTVAVGVKSKKIFFPFEGATLYASADFSDAGGERFRIGVRFLNSAGGTISESTSNYVQSGRKSHTATVPANTVYVQWITLKHEFTAESDSWTFTRPALRTTTKSFSL